jgi:hypothetical protein
VDKPAVIFYWVRFGLVLFVIVVAGIAALRRSRPEAARRDLLVGAIGTAMAVLAMAIAQMAVDYVLSGVFLIAGLVVGFALSKLRPLIAGLSAIFVMFAAIMVLFGEPEAFGVGLAVFAFSMALPLGQGLRGLMTKSPASDEPAKPTSEATA